MNNRVILDTCALIWLVNGADMDAKARSVIKEAANAGNLYVSPMSAWEVGMLVAKNRLALSIPTEIWFEKILANPAFKSLDVDAAMLIRSTALPGRPPNDPVDRMMISSARNISARLITRDRQILSYGKDGHVRCFAC